MEPGRLRWFGKNQFFANSSLTGLIFINEAKWSVEKLFWYCVLLVFAVLTIGNAVSFVNYYNSRPTETVARVATSSEDVTLPDMRLELTTSLDMFSILHKILVQTNSLDDFICKNTQRYFIRRNLDKMQNAGVHGIELGDEKALPRLIEFCNNAGTMASDILAKINMKSFLLRSMFETHRCTSLRTYRKEELQAAARNLNDALDQIEPHNILRQTYLALLFLSQLNDGSPDVQRILLDKNKYLTELEKSQISIKQFLESVDTCFKEFLVVEAEQEYAKVTMRDWTVNLTAGKQTVQYDISFDANSRAKKTTINVYAMRLNRFLVMIREMLLHLSRVRAIWTWQSDNIAYECENCWAELGGRCAGDDRICERHFDEWTFKTAYHSLIPNTTYSKSKYAELLEGYIRRHTVMPVLENIQQNTRLKIVLPHGRVDVPPLHQSNLTLQISGRFVSSIERCINYSTANCLDKCAYEKHLDSCGCYPWSFRHMENGTNYHICTEACAQAQHINSKCSLWCREELGKACQSTLLYGQASSIPLQHVGFESMIDSMGVSFWLLSVNPQLPIARVDVDLKDDRYYAVYVEKYSMTLNEFLSQFGGLLEFWLGINITGMMHLIFYIMRQSYRVYDKRSKTHRDWRRFLGIKPIDNQTQNQNCLTLNDIIESNEEIKKGMLSLQEETFESNLLLKTNRKQGISRLFKYNFLEETPLVGFSFIYNAKSKIEAYVWCIIIIALSILTIRNVVVACFDFSQGATKTSLQMLYSKQKFENITLTVTTSVYEFVNSVPIDLQRHPLGWNNTYGLYFSIENVPCIQASNEYVKKDIMHHINDALSSMMDKITVSGQSILIDKIEHLLQTKDKWQYARWKMWKNSAKAFQVQNMHVFWEAIRFHLEDLAANILLPLADAFLPPTKNHYEEGEILEAILNSTDREFMKNATDVILPLFMFLELMNQNDSQKINYLLQNVGPYHLTDTLSGAELFNIRDARLLYSTERIVDSFNKDYNVEFVDPQILADRSLSLRQMVMLTEHLIPLFIDIRTDNPDAKLDLRRVSFISNGRVRITFQVSMADGALTEKIKFQIHSYQLARALFYLEALSAHLAEYGKMEQQGRCSDVCLLQIYCSPVDFWFFWDSEYEEMNWIEGWAISKFLEYTDREISESEIFTDELWPWNIRIQHVRAIHLLYKNAVTELLNHYKETTSIWLTTQSGVSMFEPFWHHQSTLMPSTDFESNIPNCYAGTRDHCTQSCLLDVYLELCDCEPWHLHYLNPRGRICNEPCPSAQHKEGECVEKCIQLTSHQCSIPMRQEQRSRQPITHFKLEFKHDYDRAVVDPTLPLASIELILAKLQHPCITEQYAMSPSGFISRLGGLMEIWLGFNIVALIHLIIYSVKHCRKATKTQSKTGRILRKIVGEEEQEADRGDFIGRNQEACNSDHNSLNNTFLQPSKKRIEWHQEKE